MSIIKIISINILSDLSRWTQRRELLAQGLQEMQPDVVAIQEVRLPHNPAKWLADQLGFQHIYVSPKTGWERSREAIAILSRLPIESQATLDLKGQGRVAQSVIANVDNHFILLANGHFFWQPGESVVRNRQVERMIDWLKTFPVDYPRIVCGDFNATPETIAIQRMREEFDSAYANIHGRDPEYTCPTPLPRSISSRLRTFLGFFFLIRPKHLKPNWRGALDYIFVDRRLNVIDCQIVLNQPDADNALIYPSDHFGLYAEIDLV